MIGLWWVAGRRCNELFAVNPGRLGGWQRHVDEATRRRHVGRLHMVTSCWWSGGEAVEVELPVASCVAAVAIGLAVRVGRSIRESLVQGARWG